MRRIVLGQGEDRRATIVFALLVLLVKDHSRLEPGYDAELIPDEPNQPHPPNPPHPSLLRR
jgi:hypothetical protein